MNLFDDIQRHDSSPSSHNESLFQFLNRVDLPYWEEVRRLLERWYRNLPDSQKPDICRRFRKFDSRQSMSAFWELYLNEALTRLGFSLTRHPTVPDDRTTPDFLVSRHDGDFYLEAVMLSDLECERRAERRRALIYDAVNKISSLHFFLWIDCLRESPSTPSQQDLRHKLGKWLHTLDPDDVRSRFAKLAPHMEPWESLPFYDWRQGDWHIRFTAFPREEQSRGEAHGRTIGVYGPIRAIEVEDCSAIKKKLEEKASKYGQFDKPYVIALLSLRITTSQCDILEALFGAAWEHRSMVREGVIRPGGWNEGFWLSREGPPRRNVSALLTSSAVRPWTVAQAELRAIHNPWATHPVSTDLPFASVHADLEDGSLQTREATLLAAELFGIDPDWPPGQPFLK